MLSDDERPGAFLRFIKETIREFCIELKENDIAEERDTIVVFSEKWRGDKLLRISYVPQKCCSVWEVYKEMCGDLVPVLLIADNICRTGRVLLDETRVQIIKNPFPLSNDNLLPPTAA